MGNICRRIKRNPKRVKYLKDLECYRKRLANLRSLQRRQKTYLTQRLECLESQIKETELLESIYNEKLQIDSKKFEATLIEDIRYLNVCADTFRDTIEYNRAEAAFYEDEIRYILMQKNELEDQLRGLRLVSDRYHPGMEGGDLSAEHADFDLQKKMEHSMRRQMLAIEGNEKMEERFRCLHAQHTVAFSYLVEMGHKLEPDCTNLIMHQYILSKNEWSPIDTR